MAGSAISSKGIISIKPFTRCSTHMSYFLYALNTQYYQFNINSKNQIMETQTMKATNSKLKEFFVDQLKDIYWTEKKLAKTLPKLAGCKATTPELKDAFTSTATRHRLMLKGWSRFLVWLMKKSTPLNAQL